MQASHVGPGPSIQRFLGFGRGLHRHSASEQSSGATRIQASLRHSPVAPMSDAVYGPNQTLNAAALLVGFGEKGLSMSTPGSATRSIARGVRNASFSFPDDICASLTRKRVREDEIDSTCALETPLDLLAAVAAEHTHRLPSTSTALAPIRKGDTLCDVLKAQNVVTSGTNVEFFEQAFSSVDALVSALATVETRSLLCDDGAGGRVRTAALDQMFRSAPISVIERACPHWRTSELIIRALAHYDRHDVLSMRRGTGLAFPRPRLVSFNKVVQWCDVVLVTAAAVATEVAAEGLCLVLHERATLLQRAVAAPGAGIAAFQTLRAFVSTLSTYDRGSVGGRMLDALASNDASAAQSFAARYHKTLDMLTSADVIESAAASNFALALLERATASACALDCFRHWAAVAYKVFTLDDLLCALHARGTSATHIASVVSCLATIRSVEAYVWVEKRAVEGEWLHAVFSRAGKATTPAWSDWGKTAIKCDTETRGRAPVVAIATLVAAVGDESKGRTRGTASNQVVRFALGSLIAWLSGVARCEQMERARRTRLVTRKDSRYDTTGPVTANVMRWITSLLFKITSQQPAILKAAKRDVVDEALARLASPPSMKILENAMVATEPVAFED